MKLVVVFLGLVLALVGSVFFLQGIDVIKGSSMTGSTQWAIIGPIVALMGLVVVVAGVRSGDRKR